MIIVWSEEAKTTYENMIDDLICRWEISIVERFENQTNALLSDLQQHTKLCPASKKKNIRKCVIHKNTSLVYRIGKSTIELIAFVDNRTAHQY